MVFTSFRNESTSWFCANITQAWSHYMCRFFFWKHKKQKPNREKVLLVIIFTINKPWRQIFPARTKDFYFLLLCIAWISWNSQVQFAITPLLPPVLLRQKVFIRKHLKRLLLVYAWAEWQESSSTAVIRQFIFSLE